MLVVFCDRDMESFSWEGTFGGPLVGAAEEAGLFWWDLAADVEALDVIVS
jgi:hypothetical protein